MRVLYDSAVALGHHPLELAVLVSLLGCLFLTFSIRTIRRVRPLVLKLASRFISADSKLWHELVLLALWGLTLIFLATSVFLHLAEGVVEGGPQQLWDETFVRTVHQTVSPGVVNFFAAVTVLGGREANWVLGIGVGLALLWRRHYHMLGFWILGMAGNGALNEVLKKFFSRERPAFEVPFLVEANYSFPSGHAMTSILVYGLLAYVVSREFPKHRTGLLMSVTWLGAFIGTSRMVLGVHYPSDVLAGWCVALSWLIVVVAAAEVERSWYQGTHRPLAE